MASPSKVHLENFLVSEKSHDVFYPFPRLPSELRHQIWRHYLADATPQMYRFKLRCPDRALYDPWGNNLIPGDKIFLEPPGCFPGQEGTDFLQPLRVSTATRHIASVTCVESRQAVLELFPDTLRFRQLPFGWTGDEAPGGIDSADAAGLPEYVLRFNGVKDIIVFQVAWEDQQAAIGISKLKGSPPDEFLNIRHVGIGAGELQMGYDWIEANYGTPLQDCRCETEECQDYCKKEPLPSFLALFPLLQTLCIAGVPRGAIHRPGDTIQPQKGLSRKINNCPCPENGPRHSWQMIKAWDACGWFAIYDERSGCSFHKFGKIEEIRQRWRSHFPYYRALDHLEIKFIQLWDPDLSTHSQPCSSCIYRSSNVFPLS
ncbi:hypothetical protein G7Y89_g4129 [Cudoniella acicularis]|uniref:2EXR domain-containing protein n=1 Tax=Cudoniella acicularis TaxID=354080 RepID=A0A8H4RQ27_9HELO|nr:hypothetical protein G7Y89_g4129 [Cudoniella acicularis]